MALHLPSGLSLDASNSRRVPRVGSTGTCGSKSASIPSDQLESDPLTCNLDGGIYRGLIGLLGYTV